MREMKDSGIGWIKQIPITWDLVRNKYNFVLNKRIIGNKWKKTQLLSLTKNGIKKINDGEQTGKVPASLATYQKVKKDDIVMCLFDLDCSAVFSGRSECDGMISPAYKCFRCNENLDPKYVDLYFRTVFVDRKYMRYSKNVRYSLASEEFLALPILVPPIDEQKKIANFLDEQCKKINEVITDIQSQIDTLEDYKKSVISETVTKGLDSDAVMKDSGISHIDSIPLHWNTLKLKYASTLKGRIGWQGLRTEEYRDEGPYLVTGTDFNKGYINWNSCVHISKERFEQDKNIQIQEDDLLITKDGTIGKIAMAKGCPAEVSLNSGVFIVRNNRKYKYIDKFFYYIILSKQFSLWFELSQHGNSTIKHLTQEIFYEFTFAYPPIVEQTQIVDFLDDKCAKIDYIIENKKEQLEALEQYKKSLIYEYVTGKKEVPNE